MNTWPTVPIGDVVARAERPVIPMPGNTYRQIGVKLWGEGAYEREEMDGSQTKYARLYRVETGDIIVNKIWARNGSVAVVPQSLAGCFGSGEFPMFAPKLDRLDVRWMHWLTKTPRFWAQCDEQSRGTSGKNRIRPEKFLSIEMRLPPIAEQRRIVVKIEELATKIQEARKLRKEAIEDVEALLRSIVSGDTQSIPTSMRELVRLRLPDVAVRAHETYQFAGVYSFGRGVFRGALKSGMEFAYPRLTRLQAGNFVYPKLMAWEGALGVVPPECDGCVVSTEFPVFEVNEDRVFHEVLDTYFRNPSIWPKIAGESTGTNVRRRRLNPQDFLDYKMPLPSQRTQITLRNVRAKIDALRRLQAATATEIDCLLPSVLEEAFRGKL